MKNKNYIPTILLLIISIYFAQGPLYPKGSIISQVIIFIILVLSGIYWIKTMFLKSTKSGFYIVWTVLLLLNIIGYVFSGDFSSTLNFGEIKNMLLVALPFYPFYFFSKKNIISEKQLIWFFLLMVMVLIADFVFNRSTILSMRGGYNDDVVNNTSYGFVRLIPYVLLLKDKKTLSMLLSFILMFFIIQGAKRGAMISGIIGFAFIAYFHLRTIDRKNQLKNIIGVVLGVTLLGIYSYKYFQQNDFLLQRMQSMLEGDSSGRDIIYSNLFNAWFNSDSFKVLLFGHGFGSSIILSGTGNWAHNDWLELLSSFGLTGILVYVYLFISAIKIPLREQWETDRKIMIYAILCLWFFTTLVSMSYNNPISVIQTVLLGYLIGSQEKKQNENSSTR